MDTPELNCPLRESSLCSQASAVALCSLPDLRSAVRSFLTVFLSFLPQPPLQPPSLSEELLQTSSCLQHRYKVYQSCVELVSSGFGIDTGDGARGPGNLSRGAGRAQRLTGLVLWLEFAVCD